MRIIQPFLFGLFLTAVLTLGACKTCDKCEIAAGHLTEAAGCKEILTGNVAESQAGLIYEYDGEGTLTMQHINAGFNCCPGVIAAEVEISGNSIMISEFESQSGCYCLCLFDLSFRIDRLPPGVYILTIKEPYLGQGDPVIEASLDLSDRTSGEVYFTRTQYPW